MKYGATSGQQSETCTEVSNRRVCASFVEEPASGNGWCIRPPAALVCCLWVVLGLMIGCEQPLAVAFNPGGAKDLALKGEIGVKGHITRPLVYNGKTYPKDSKVVVYETFLIRQSGGRPPSYHFEGLYDPAKKADKFVLPQGAIDTIYYSVLEPHRKEHLPVPKEYFERDP